ncbi:hypothetical protein Droror1_Dr00025212 [Drosera rotundifolia]
MVLLLVPLLIMAYGRFQPFSTSLFRYQFLILASSKLVLFLIRVRGFVGHLSFHLNFALLRFDFVEAAFISPQSVKKIHGLVRDLNDFFVSKVVTLIKREVCVDIGFENCLVSCVVSF